MWGRNIIFNKTLKWRYYYIIMAFQNILMDSTNNLYTFQSLGTLAGAAGVTFIISNVIQSVFNYNPKWLALAVAEIISFAIIIQSGSDKFSDYFIAIVNGFLIYSTAIGGNALTGKPTSSRATSSEQSEMLGTGLVKHPVIKTKRKFLSNWF